jgi:hypothetical protein
MHALSRGSESWLRSSSDLRDSSSQTRRRQSPLAMSVIGDTMMAPHERRGCAPPTETRRHRRLNAVTSDDHGVEHMHAISPLCACQVTSSCSWACTDIVPSAPPATIRSRDRGSPGSSDTKARVTLTLDSVMVDTKFKSCTRYVRTVLSLPKTTNLSDICRR